MLFDLFQEDDFLNHKDVIKAYSKTSLLLLLLFNSESGKGNYPGKLFEYLATKLPILAFGPENSDVKNFFKNSFIKIDQTL